MKKSFLWRNKMKKALLTAIVLVIGLLAAMANAEITGVVGAPSSAGTPPAILLVPPTDVLDNVVTNTGQEGFDEAKVVTTAAHAIDVGGPIPSPIPIGTLVNSHMIFLNAPEGAGVITTGNVVWTFSQPILGVMSDYRGDLEVASTPELGAPATNYTVAVLPDRAPPFNARGMEGDSYVVLGNQITVNMAVSQPGDWIRVVTCAQGSQGFWKNHPGSWPDPTITIGGRVYTVAQAIALMKAPTKGNKALTMFPQVVAAKLNQLTAGAAGCIPDCVGIGATIDAADAWMAENDPEGDKVKANSEAWQAGEPLYDVLDAYNNEELLCAPII
jgi:hypothetical protein